MTTCVYDRRTKTIAADTQNTDSAQTIYRVAKIERLKNGSYFLGSGNCFTIGITKRWAETGFAESKRPEYGVMFEDPDEYGFSCLVISQDGNTITLIDNEMQPTLILDDYAAVGSGGAFAIGALDAGATVEQALDIACQRDSSTSHPVHVVKL